MYAVIMDDYIYVLFWLECIPGMLPSDLQTVHKTFFSRDTFPRYTGDAVNPVNRKGLGRFPRAEPLSVYFRFPKDSIA